MQKFRSLEFPLVWGQGDKREFALPDARFNIEICWVMGGPAQVEPAGRKSLDKKSLEIVGPTFGISAFVAYGKVTVSRVLADIPIKDFIREGILLTMTGGAKVYLRPGLRSHEITVPGLTRAVVVPTTVVVDLVRL